MYWSVDEDKTVNIELKKMYEWQQVQKYNIKRDLHLSNKAKIVKMVGFRSFVHILMLRMKNSYSLILFF